MTVQVLPPNSSEGFHKKKTRNAHMKTRFSSRKEDQKQPEYAQKDALREHTRAANRARTNDSWHPTVRKNGRRQLRYFPFPLSDTACMPALPISLISHTQSTIAS